MTYKKLFSTLSIGLTFICSLHAETDQSSPYYKIGYQLLQPVVKTESIPPNLLKNPLKTLLKEKPSSKRFKKAFCQIQLLIKGLEASIEDGSAQYVTVKDNPLPYLHCFTQADDLAEALSALGSLLVKNSGNFNSFINPFAKMFIEPLFMGKASTTSQSYKLAKDLTTSTLNKNFSIDRAEDIGLNNLIKELSPKIDALTKHVTHPSRTESNNRARDAFAGLKAGINSFSLKKHLAGKDEHIKLLLTLEHKVFKQLIKLPEALIKDDLSPLIEALGKELASVGDGLKKIS